MGFSKRIQSGLPFAPAIALLICVLVSTAGNASVVPISSRANLVGLSDASVRDDGRLQTKHEVAGLLIINSSGARSRSSVAQGLVKILREAESFMTSDESLLVRPRTLASSVSELNATSSTGSVGNLPSDGGPLPEASGIRIARSVVNIEPNRAGNLPAAKGNRTVDLWNGIAESTTVSSASISGGNARSLPAPNDAFQNALSETMSASPGSSAPDAITSIYTWDGGGANNNITTTQNWVGDVLPTANSDIIWAGTTRLAVNVDIGGPAKTWTFDSTAGAFVISGAAFTISNGIVNNSTATQTINNAATLTLAQTWSATSGNLIFGGNIDNGGFLLTISGGANTTANGIISGTGGLTKSGSGTLTFSGANSYSGATIVSAGVLNIRDSTGLGTASGGTTVNIGAALQLQGGITVGNETLTLDGTGISSDGALRNISGNNSWAGNITINSTTRINSDAGTLTLDVSSGSAITGTDDNLQIGGAGNVTINDIITLGTGSLTKDGTGTLILNAANSYTGATFVNAGILNIQNSNGLGTIGTGTTVANNATLQLQGNITVGLETLNIRGAGATGQTGALVNVSGNNTYGGLLTLAGNTTLSSNSGMLNLTNTGTITGATYGLTLNGAGNGSIASIIGTTTGSLTKNGTGTWSLSGANTFTGSTTVAQGTLTLANSSGSALGFTSAVTVNSGATLLLGANNQINNAAQIILNGGTFAKGNFSEGSASTAGMGALTLTAAGSHLDLGTGAVGTLTFAGFAPGSFTLIIDNWSGTASTSGNGSTDRLIFASNQSGNLSHFNFTGFAPGATQFDLGNGYWEVVAVPEAGTYFSGLLVLALILFHHRKQIQQLVDRRRTSRRVRFSTVDGTGVAS